MKKGDKFHLLLKDELSKKDWFIIDFVASNLRNLIRNMKKWQPIYKIIKEELTLQNRWKLHPRGDPTKGFNKGWGKRKNKKG